MIDLNSKEFNSNGPIINDGQAGKVKVKITGITKRAIDEEASKPDYKVAFTGENGGVLNAGFYYPKNKEDKTAEQNQKTANLNIGRILAMARAVVPNDFEFPTVENPKDAFDRLFSIIREHGIDKEVNIFVTYGTPGYPKDFLNLRYFDFIEKVDTEFSRLVPKKNDLMARIQPDSDGGDEGDMTASTQTANVTASADVEEWD